MSTVRTITYDIYNVGKFIFHELTITRNEYFHVSISTNIDPFESRLIKIDFRFRKIKGRTNKIESNVSFVIDIFQIRRWFIPRRGGENRRSYNRKQSSRLGRRISQRVVYAFPSLPVHGSLIYGVFAIVRYICNP